MSNTNTGMALHRNSDVLDLSLLLRENGRAEQARDIQALTELVGHMSRDLDAASREISAMRRELGELRELHGAPLHNIARQGIDAASRQVRQMKERVGAVKDSIVQGAKDAVAAVKAKGISALNGALSFLGVRRELEHIRQESTEQVARCDRSLARIENVSNRYHEAGSAARNLGRAILGRDAKEDTKPMGRLAKLASAPHQAMKNLHAGMVKRADDALGRLEKLEQAAKPSMLENLQARREESAKEQDAVPSPAKSKEPSL